MINRFWSLSGHSLSICTHILVTDWPLLSRKLGLIRSFRLLILLGANFHAEAEATAASETAQAAF